MNKFDRFLEKAANRKRYSLRRILAGVVVFATTYALILPAITIETDVAEDDPGIVLNSDGQTETQNPAVILEKIIEDTSYKITAEAEEEILPAGSVLSAEIVKEEEKQKLLDRIHEQNPKMETDEEILSIKIMDESENEVQPQGSLHFQIERELRVDERTPQLLLIKETPTGEYETELLDTEEHQVVAVNTEKKQIVSFVTDRTGYFTAVYEKEETETATEEIPPEVLTETETEEPEEIVSDEESEEPAETAEETEPVIEEAEDFVFFERVNGLDVNVRADYTAFPEGTTMTVYAVNDENIEETVANTVEGKVRKVSAVDITFLDAYDNEVQPSSPIQVMITPSEAPKQAEAVSVVHVDNEGNGEKIEDIETTENTIAFEAEQFSVYAVVYTVDFSYEVDGKAFTFSMEGGSTMSFKDLVIALGIETEEDIDSFMEEVEDVVFSDPSLIRITKNEKFLFFGEKDWIMESLEPFSTKETLTITMKDGQVFAVQVTDEQLYVNVITADGSGYLITVTYKSDAGIPEDAELEASEIIDTEEYETYLSRTAETLGQETDALSYARFFDIKIVKDNEIIQPKEDSVVGVSIELNDAAGENLSVVHFGEEPEVLDSTTEENSVVFETTGFSVYAIVDAPEPQGIKVVNELSDLTDGTAFYLSYGGLQNYTTNKLNGNSAFIETNNSEDADEWYFESADDGSFYIYTMKDGIKQYMHNQSGNLVSLSNTNKTAFEISQAAEGKFYLKKAGEDKWFQHSGSGKGMRFYTDNNNATNSQITISYADSYDVYDDPYKLDGKTYGIAFHNDTATAAAMMADEIKVTGTDELSAVDMLMRPDVLDNEGILLVAEGSDIQEWTFESIEEDYYYLKTTVNGATKYLTVNGKNITLSDEPDPKNHSVIKAVPGTGASSGKWHFTVNGYNVSADLSGTSARGFAGANNNGTSTWLNLVERSVLNDDDFTLYTAQKVSVSDTVNVHDGQQVVIYTRIWNEEKKKYEFFAVDHDGSLDNM